MVVDIRVDSSSGRSRLKLNLAKCVGGAGDTGDEIFGSGVEVQDLVLDWDKELQQKLHALQKQQKHGLHDQQLHRVQQQHPNSDRWTGLQSDDRFKMLHGNLLDKLRNTPEWFDVRQMATITHSLGKMTIADHDFFTEIVKLRARIAKEGNPQHLSNIVWSFAKLEYKSQDLFAAVAGEHKRIARDGKVQEHLTNTLWSFTVAGKLDLGKELIEKLWNLIGKLFKE
ncbi:hypothetical protein ScalyP_jg8675 [Parmales sp. scaly parma]|nr:hypothetical protein ScalyP_jg8675 [Parmales sp. scaly parma]